MDFFSRIADAQGNWNVLNHSFYRRWSKGTLTRDELCFYAGEYRHAVTAVSEAATAAARCADPVLEPELSEHAREEADHIELWNKFAAALGATTQRTPLPQTQRLRRAWTAGSNLLEHLAVLYAVESAQPAIAATKLEGLVTHYGMKPAGPEASYFSIHAKRDHEHAQQSRGLISERLETSCTNRLIDLAEQALEANWRLLDGVEQNA